MMSLQQALIYLRSPFKMRRCFLHPVIADGGLALTLQVAKISVSFR